MTYAISAPRAIRALYYSWEFGIRGANKILASEPAGDCEVRSAGGTAKRTCGLYRTKKDATRDLVRVIAMAASQAGRIGKDLADVRCVEVVRSANIPSAAVRPLA